MKNIQAYKTRWGGWGHSKRHQSRRKDARSLLQLTTLRLEITCFSTTVSSKRGHTLIHSNLSTCKDFLSYSYLVAILISYFQHFLIAWSIVQLISFHVEYFLPNFNFIYSLRKFISHAQFDIYWTFTNAICCFYQTDFFFISQYCNQYTVYLFQHYMWEFRSFFSLNLIGFDD